MFTNIIPISDKLKKYISSFTITQHERSFPLTYTAFPNIGTCLSFFNLTAIQIQSEGVIFRKDESKEPAIILLGRLTRPTLITFQNPVEEISINFKPCGINYFFSTPFSAMARKPHQLLQDPKWVEFISTLFMQPMSERIALVEAFLLLNLNEQDTAMLDRIFNTVAIIATLKVSELANVAYMSERSFLRHFKKYLGCSPSTYKKILRFRTMFDFQYSKNIKPFHRFLLTERYWDASHFRKEFVQFTGTAPRQFKNASLMAGNGSSIFKLV